ncbi:MAG: hypothetical protein Q7W30_02530 [Coriobacteriia bacterium]|nr:hypothetical protein [Coriobacteriia bacterium]
MPRGDRTRPATKSDSRAFIAKASEFLIAMEEALSASRWDAAGLAAIHAGISAGDAVLAYRGGIRSAGQDHRAAVDLLQQILGEAAIGPSRHLKRLIDKKNLVEYEQRRLTQAEALDLAEHARRFVSWATEQAPKAE